MTSQSNWCSADSWYTDDKLTLRSKNIPRNQIDDTKIIPNTYTYSIADNSCFQQIPYLECNDLNIVLGLGLIDDKAVGSFFCATLVANDAIIGKNINCTHWDADTLCNWQLNKITTNSGTVLKNIFFENLNSGILNQTTIDSCYIQTNNLSGTNCIITATDLFPTNIICKSGSFYNTKCNNDNIILQGKFDWFNNSTIRGTGLGTFNISNSFNLALLIGDISFKDGSVNLGVINGNVIFSGAAINSGSITGNCIFLDSTRNYGSISGTVSFSGTSQNHGIVKQATFSDTSKNYGRLLQYSIFNSGTLNSGFLENGGRFINAQNFGTVLGDTQFIGSSTNIGLVYGNAEFLTLSCNYGNVSGNITTDNTCGNS